jgi:subtilisin family serine protease
MPIRYSQKRVSTVACAVALTLAGCERVGPPATAPQQQQSAAIPLSSGGRPGMSLQSILDALATPGATDGTILVGLKEETAQRGVSATGVELPLQARFAAAAALGGAFPELEMVNGVARAVQGQRGGLTFTDTIYRTFLRMRGSKGAPLNLLLLGRLRQHANVDYIAPNYVNGTAFGLPAHVAFVNATMAETRGWQVDTMRAPSVWALGYTGGSLPLGHLDSGFELSNPDLAFNSSFYNFTTGYADNVCTSGSPAVCYYEQPYHGTGTLGAAIGTSNGVGAVGIAPSTAGANIAKVMYLRANGSTPIPVDAFSDAVRYISNLSSDYGSRTGVATTSIGYTTTDTLAYPTLGDAFNYGVNQGRTVWFAAASNTGQQGGGFVAVPARFGNVIAVGALDRSGQLVKASFSPIDPKIEFVAPGTNVFIPWNHNDPSHPSYTVTLDGTSFATPMVAAVAKLVLQKFPSLSPAGVRQHLATYARDLGPAGRDASYGFGLADAYCAVQQMTPCAP